MPRKFVASIIVLALPLSACAKAEGYDPNAPSTQPTTPRPSTPSTATPWQPPKPPAPQPAVAKVGQPIKIHQLGKVKWDDPNPLWPNATITITSVRTLRVDPAYPKVLPNPGTMFAVVTVDTTLHRAPFGLSVDTLKLKSPSGTEYDVNKNFRARKDAFVVLDEATSLTGGSGVLLYSIPASGLPKGSVITGEVVSGQPFTWQLP
ncbi:hypothetical protein HPO96_07280 [Kribbella sandramycini]|uniref:DUF4352 domain-containing protein n=1 Tax=Kribbella sandramycini TaxID=60450 RepID=A0A7Y4KWN6_9ACTN|nr:hypothetical protein [Kribbella sandramycini]MBB6567345.1 hypothetical protein [Kribbella sandramycini]NOL40042.1 hypothetical protein [Kribbella sandramycini]